MTAISWCSLQSHASQLAHKALGRKKSQLNKVHRSIAGPLQGTKMQLHLVPNPLCNLRLDKTLSFKPTAQLYLLSPIKMHQASLCCPQLKDSHLVPAQAVDKPLLQQQNPPWRTATKLALAKAKVKAKITRFLKQKTLPQTRSKPAL